MTGKRKKSRALHGRNAERDVSPDNPIIAAVRRSLPVGGSVTFDVDRPPDRVLDRVTAFFFNDETIREIGVLVLKALLTGDREIVTTLKDALKEADHIFRRDRERVLREKVVKYLPELIGSGMGIVAIKREIEKRSNNDQKLDPHRWNRLRQELCLVKLPTGRPKKVGTKR